MTIDISELEQIATQVWQLLMGSDISPTGNTATIPNETAPTVSFVELTGAYSATVALHIDDQLIRSAAATMFGVEGERVSDTEMQDTARELANMVGGNVKCLVDQPTTLGLPEIAPADQFYSEHQTPSQHLAFEHGGAPLHVMVYNA